MRLVEGDALDFLGGLPDASVDLVLTDPPYKFNRGTTYYRRWFSDLPDEAWPKVMAELYRVLCDDRHAYVICDRRTEDLFIGAGRSAGFTFLRKIIWNKATPALGQGVYRSQYEVVLLFSKGTRAGNSRRYGDVLTFRRVRTRDHYPTEKPVELLKVLIAQSTTRGEVGLDPFCGSGSVGHAARELGRQAILCDLDATAAARRLRVGIATGQGTIPKRNGP